MQHAENAWALDLWLQMSFIHFMRQGSHTKQDNNLRGSQMTAIQHHRELSTHSEKSLPLSPSSVPERQTRVLTEQTPNDDLSHLSSKEPEFDRTSSQKNVCPRDLLKTIEKSIYNQQSLIAEYGNGWASLVAQRLKRLPAMRETWL